MEERNLRNSADENGAENNSYGVVSGAADGGEQTGNTADESAESAQTETVDDILAEIMGGDGVFNDDFSGLYARYLGGGKSPAAAGTGQRVEYEAPPEQNYKTPVKKGGFEEKLPDGMRVVYDAAEEDAKRPEFTPGGEVRYPTMGMGEAEERVVYDASWEEQAKKEAARRDARMRDAALKGDSTYVRSFVSGGMPMAKRGSTAEVRPAVNPRYIDPLSEDDTPRPTDRATLAAQTRMSERQENTVNNTEKSDNNSSFFQDGFSAKNGDTAAAYGKTYGVPSRGMPAAASEKTVTDNINSASGKSAIYEKPSTPEKPIIDDAVLDAFARSQTGEEDFRAKWKNEIELAEKRKKERAAAESRKKAERQAELERQNAEKKALAGDLPGIPLEIDGKKEAEKVISSAVQSRTPAAPEGGKIGGGDGFGFVFRDDDDTDIDEADVVERISPRELAAEKKELQTEKKVKKSAGERLSFFFKTRFSAEGIRRWAADVFPKKGDGKGEIVRKIVRIVSFIVFMAAVIYLAVYFVKYEQRKKLDDEIGREIEQTLPSAEIDTAWANIKAKYPNVEFPEGMNINFANTYAINSDVVGYLRIAGEKTNIGTILLQKKGDDSYYLYRDLYGKKSRYGNPYVKASSSMARSGLSQNTIIYGHNTHDGLMFHELENYMQPSGFIDAPIVTLDTLFEQTKWKIFAVILTNSTADMDNGYVFSYLYSDFNSKQHFQSVLDGINARSMIHTGVDVNTNDKILTLYTCYQSLFEGGRLVVFARQLRNGETEEINTSKVYYNSNARFPQAYYDARKMTNPFKEESTTVAPSPTPAPVPTERTTGESAAKEGTTEKAESTTAATNAAENTTSGGSGAAATSVQTETTAGAR